jgi:hypothetical protein
MLLEKHQQGQQLVWIISLGTVTKAKTNQFFCDQFLDQLLFGNSYCVTNFYVTVFLVTFFPVTFSSCIFCCLQGVLQEIKP